MPVPDWVKASFKNGEFDVELLKSDITVYRAHGGQSKPVGNFFGAVKPTNAAEAERMYNVVDYGNELQEVSTFVIPKGTTVIKGQVEGGTGIQYYIEGAQDMVKQIGQPEYLPSPGF